ncbi:MAG: hypothetical protein ACI9H6_000102 [Patiriisocius sp.]|jgi:hypothetical protein
MLPVGSTACVDGLDAGPGLRLTINVSVQVVA